MVRNRFFWLGVIIATAIVPMAGAAIGPAVRIPLAGKPGNIAYDPWRNYLYVSNNTLNQLDVIDGTTQSVKAPIFVGSQPRGLDIDGTGTYAYVCNYGANNLSKVNLQTGVEAGRISVPGSPTNIAIAANGTGQIRMGDYEGDAFEGFAFNAITGSVGSQTENFWFDAASPNKQFLLRTDYNWIKKYDSAAGNWSGAVSIPGFGIDHWNWIDTLAVGNDGKWTMVTNNDGTRILDENLAIYGTLPNDYRGLAIDSSAGLGYGINGTTLDVIDLECCLVTDSINLPKSIHYNTGFPETYQWTNLLLSPDGTTLYELNTDGITIISTGIPEPGMICLLGMGGLALAARKKKIRNSPQ